MNFCATLNPDCSTCYSCHISDSPAAARWEVQRLRILKRTTIALHCPTSQTTPCPNTHRRKCRSRVSPPPQHCPTHSGSICMRYTRSFSRWLILPTTLRRDIRTRWILQAPDELTSSERLMGTVIEMREHRGPPKSITTS